MRTTAIDRMSWDAIAREGDRYESPAWHEQELKETQQRYDAGAEESMDWATAKHDLRKSLDAAADTEIRIRGP
jgi:Putative addiction module component